MSEETKLSYLRTLSTSEIDELFHLTPVTDVPREGAEHLYLSGLSPEALFTSYHDVLEVMEWLHQQGARSWCDLGAGIGRTCVLWSWLFDGASTGIECVPERLNVARMACLRLRLLKAQWLEADFSSPDFKLPDSDVYFIYLATGPALDHLLMKLRRRSTLAYLVVIESHGDLKPRLQWESWWLTPLSQRFGLTSKRHDPWIQIYRTRPYHPARALEDSWEGRSGLLPSELQLHPSPLGYILSKSFQKNWELVLSEQGVMWTMDTLSLCWHESQSVEGQYPRRVVKWGEVQIGLRRIPDELPYKRWSSWRRNQTKLRYKTLTGEGGEAVTLRKIFISPTCVLEFSHGLRVEWTKLVLLEEVL